MEISVQLEDEYYQNGKTQIWKMYDNFGLLVQIWAKIIVRFLNFSVF